jgi:hypothetical protein
LFSRVAGADDKYRFEIKDILEMEMKLLEALDYYLVVYHPYRPLLQYGSVSHDFEFEYHVAFFH